MEMRLFFVLGYFLFLVLTGINSNAQKNEVLIAKESEWKYLDDGSDQDTAWRRLDFDDSQWQSGQAKLGYGDDNNNTTLSFGPDENNKYVTTYFRYTFSINEVSDSDEFSANILYDDGAVVYINGNEVFRCDMPQGDIYYNTLSTGDIGGILETTFHHYNISADNFVAGENIIAAEVHQADITSSDIGFDFELIQSSIIPVNISASVEPLIQNNWQTFMWPYNAYLPIKADGPNGRVGNECGFTAMARLIHYWKHVPNGVGTISANYVGIDYYCDLDNLNLDYSKMPYELNWEDNEEDYNEIAKLMLATATIGAKINIGAIGNEAEIAPALAEYFYFKTSAEVVYRNDFTREEWINIFKTELSAGRPIIITGRTEDSPAPGEFGRVYGHYFICDGYNEQDQFYYNYMFSNIKAYADIDEMGDYSEHHYAIIGLEPASYLVKQTVSVCDGEEYNGWTEEGDYEEEYTSSRLTDSIVNTSLIVHPLPDKPVISRSENTLISNESTGNQWYLNGTAIHNATSNTLDIEEPGDYKVIVTNENNCTNNSEIFSVDELYTALEKPIPAIYNVYLNPENRTLIINGEIIESAEVNIYNIQGIPIKKLADVSELPVSIDLSFCTNGYYVVCVQNERVNFKTKILLH